MEWVTPAVNNPPTVAEIGGALQFQLQPPGDGETRAGQYLSKRTYDLRNSSLTIRLAQAAIPKQETSSVVTWFGVCSPGGTRIGGPCLLGEVQYTTLWFAQRVNNSPIAAQVQYDASSHRLLRISMGPTLATLDTSPDGNGWSTPEQFSLQPSFDMRAVHVVIGVSYGANLGESVDIRWDELNTGSNEPSCGPQLLNDEFGGFEAPSWFWRPVNPGECTLEDSNGALSITTVGACGYESRPLIDLRNRWLQTEVTPYADSEITFTIRRNDGWAVRFISNGQVVKAQAKTAAETPFVDVGSLSDATFVRWRFDADGDTLKLVAFNSSGTERTLVSLTSAPIDHVFVELASASTTETPALAQFEYVLGGE